VLGKIIWNTYIWSILKYCLKYFVYQIFFQKFICESFFRKETLRKLLFSSCKYGECIPNSAMHSSNQKVSFAKLWHMELIGWESVTIDLSAMLCLQTVGCCSKHSPRADEPDGIICWYCPMAQRAYLLYYLHDGLDVSYRWHWMLPPARFVFTSRTYACFSYRWCTAGLETFCWNLTVHACVGNQNHTQ